MSDNTVPEAVEGHAPVGGILGADFHIVRCSCGWEGDRDTWDAHLPEATDGPGE